MSIASPAFVYSEPISDKGSTIDLKELRSIIQMWTDGGSDIFVTLDGSIPVENGANTFKIAAGASWESPPGIGTESIRYIGSSPAAGRLSVVAL